MSPAMTGLPRQDFAHLSGLNDKVLRLQNIMRQTVDAKPGPSCRITLQDADAGETVLLLSYQSHDVPAPCALRSAAYVREGAAQAAAYRDALPPVFADRPVALRLFNQDAMLVGADMSFNPGVKAKIEQGFARVEVAGIHGHNPVYGCFVAGIGRESRHALVQALQGCPANLHFAALHHTV